VHTLAATPAPDWMRTGVALGLEFLGRLGGDGNTGFAASVVSFF
jgi:hypothetical protein